MTTADEIVERYRSLPLNDDQVARVNRIREGFADLHRLIVDSAPYSSRERSLAETNLEQAGLWAVKAISRDRA